MYTHKVHSQFRFPKSWNELKSLLFKKHDGSGDFRFHQIPLSSLVSYKNQSDVFYENILQPEYAVTKVNNEVNFKKWRKNWQSFITSEIGALTRRVDGGVADIAVKLWNKTSEKLDYIQVKVLYFEESGKLYKSEYAEVFGVKPLSSVNVPVYDSPKGSIVNVHITQVVAKAFDFEYCQGSYE